jgi:hypothetical protein
METVLQTDLMQYARLWCMHACMLESMVLLCYKCFIGKGDKCVINLLPAGLLSRVQYKCICFLPLLCKSTMTTTPRVPLNLSDHTELLRAVRKSISYDCFRNDLKITGLSMYLPEGRRRRFKGKPVLPTLVLQTDSSRCLNLRGAVLNHPPPNTAYFTITAGDIYQKCWDRAIATCGRRVCMNCKDMHLRIGRPNERLQELMLQLLRTHNRK